MPSRFLTRREILSVAILSSIVFNCDAYDKNNQMEYVGLEIKQNDIFYKEQKLLTTKGESLAKSFDNCSEIIETAWNNRKNNFTNWITKESLQDKLNDNGVLQNGLVLLYSAWEYFSGSPLLTNKDTIQERIEKLEKIFNFTAVNTLASDVSWYLNNEKWKGAFWIDAVKLNKGTKKIANKTTFENIKKQLKSNKETKLDKFNIQTVIQQFKDIKDFKTLQMVCKKFGICMEELHYNPIPLTDENRKYFPNIETQHLYTKNDIKFKELNDSNGERIEFPENTQLATSDGITKYEVWYPITWGECVNDGDREITKYHKVPCTFKQYMYIKEKAQGNDNEANVAKEFLKIVNDIEYSDFATYDYYSDEIERERSYGANLSKINQEHLKFVRIIVDTWENPYEKYGFLKEKWPDLLKQTEISFSYTDWNKLTPDTKTTIKKEVKKLEIVYTVQDFLQDYNNQATFAVPNEVTSIGGENFMECNSLKEITIPSSVTSIESHCFVGCENLENITIPSSVISIEDVCFYECPKLNNVTINEGVTSIGERCFEGCRNLKNITIPSSVIEIGSGCFYDTTTQVKIILDPEEKNLDVIAQLISKLGIERVSVADGNGKTINFHSDEIAKGYIISKSKTFYWLKKADINEAKVEIPDGVKALADGCFRNCQNLSNIIISNKVTSIGNHCFERCDKLEKITIPTSIVSIGNSGFYNCYSMQSIQILPGVNSIGEECFALNQELTEITIPSSVTFIGDYCFSCCEKLEKIILEEGVAYIGNGCFSECKKLEEITIPNSVIFVGNKCFDNCYKLAAIKVIIGEKNREKNIEVFNKLKDEYGDIVKPVNTKGEVIKEDF